MDLFQSASLSSAAACGALLATIISLWLRPRWLWIALFAIAIGCGYGANVLFGPAALWAMVLAGALLAYRQSKREAARVISRIVIVCVAVLLGMHALPGFHNPLLAREIVLSPGAAPYSLYFNFDKTFVGVLLLGIGVTRASSSPLAGVRVAAPIIIATVALGIGLSLALGYVAFAPKWTEFFWTWALVNLLLTCITEEAFFRAFIQQELSTALGASRRASMITVGVSALLFGLAHWAGGWRYVLLATIAGVGYATVYQRTRRVELSILAHFVLNATHFLFFTYPYVA